MTSEIEQFDAGFVAPFLSEQFGERGDDALLATILATPPNSSDTISLSGVVVGRLISSDAEGDEFGTRLREEVVDTVELRIPREQIAGTYTPEIDTLVPLARYAGEPFALREVVSLDPSFAHVRCERAHVESFRQSSSIRD